MPIEEKVSQRHIKRLMVQNSGNMHCNINSIRISVLRTQLTQFLPATLMYKN